MVCSCSQVEYRKTKKLLVKLLFNSQAMVSHGRVELLAHPLSQKYLQMKWNSYGKYYHVANLLIYCVFLVFVTLYSSLLMNNVFDVQMPTVVDPINLTETITTAAFADNVYRFKYCIFNAKT